MSPTIAPPGCNTLAANGPRTAPDQSLIPGVTERFEEQQHSAVFIRIELSAAQERRRSTETVQCPPSHRRNTPRPRPCVTHLNLAAAIHDWPSRAVRHPKVKHLTMSLALTVMALLTAGCARSPEHRKAPTFRGYRRCAMRHARYADKGLSCRASTPPGSMQ
jgi:hypothetical protein